MFNFNGINIGGSDYRPLVITLLLAVAYFGGIVLSVNYCENKHTTIVGQNGTRYESYLEPCDDNDFQAAHEFIMLMEKEKDGGWSKWDQHDIEEAKEYVFRKEALFLMSQNDETAKKRIIYLLKEEGSNNDHVSMLIDLAMENDDDAFVKTLANQYAEGVSDESLSKLIEFLTYKPTEENKIFAEKLISKFLSLSNTSLLNYLANKQDKKDSEMILGLLAEKEKDIPTRPAMGLSKLDDESPLVDYNNSIKDYNDGCKYILHVAIASKNQYLAQRVITKAKPSIAYTDLGDWCHVVEKQPKNVSSNYEAFKLSLDNSDVNSIKSTYQEAVRSGAFK